MLWDGFFGVFIYTCRYKELEPARERIIMKIPSILKAVGAVALAMPALGWLYQAMASQVDRRRYPPPGELVDVGGYRLHIYGLGTQHAGPAVILDAGLGCTCMDWDNVQGEIAAFAR